VSKVRRNIQQEFQDVTDQNKIPIHTIIKKNTPPPPKKGAIIRKIKEIKSKLQVFTDEQIG
jgi:hypothetical protein